MLLAWSSWLLGAIFYFYQFLLQVSPSVMVPELMQSFQWNATALGVLASFYFYVYAGMQIPVGIMLDRMGTRRLLILATLTCSLGCFIFGIAHGFALAVTGRVLMGFGSAFAAVSCMNIASIYFSTHRFALLTGLMITIGMLGATAGEAPLALLVAHLGWRPTMMIFGGSGLVLCLLTAWLIPPKGPLASHPPLHSSLWTSLLHLFENPQNWLLALYGGLMYLPTSAFAALWGVPYLMFRDHLSRPVAAGIISLIFIGWAVGSPIFGWFSDWINRRNLPMIFSSATSFLCLCAAIYCPADHPWITASLLFFFGLCSSGFVLSFAAIRENNPIEQNATSLGFMNAMNMLGGAVAQPLIGLLLDYGWNNNLSHGVRIYNMHDYHIALIFLPGALLVALLILPFIRETFCERVAE